VRFCVGVDSMEARKAIPRRHGPALQVLEESLHLETRRRFVRTCHLPLEVMCVGRRAVGREGDPPISSACRRSSIRYLASSKLVASPSYRHHISARGRARTHGAGMVAMCRPRAAFGWTAQCVRGTARWSGGMRGVLGKSLPVSRRRDPAVEPKPRSAEYGTDRDTSKGWRCGRRVCCVTTRRRLGTPVNPCTTSGQDRKVRRNTVGWWLRSAGIDRRVRYDGNGGTVVPRLEWFTAGAWVGSGAYEERALTNAEQHPGLLYDAQLGTCVKPSEQRFGTGPRRLGCHTSRSFEILD
jgi:hypothetical protein